MIELGQLRLKSTRDGVVLQRVAVNRLNGKLEWADIPCVDEAGNPIVTVSLAPTSKLINILTDADGRKYSA